LVALVVTTDFDLTADAVVAACDDRGIEVVRFDIADFPDELAFTADDFTRSRTLCVRERTVDLADVDAVLYQRPSDVAVGHDLRNDPRRLDLARRTVAGLLYGIDGLWINRPDRDMTASFKVYQDHLARQLGLRTPRTLVTNDPATVREVAATGRSLVFKLMHGRLAQPDGRPATVLTTPVTPEHIEHADQVRFAPTMFQEYVPKTCEIRMTVVGRTVFPVTIDSQSEQKTSVDWRGTGGDSPPYGDFRPVPDDVLAAVPAMMDRLGLVYGAFDFIVDEAGRWVFLEVNSMGRYVWIEEDLGLPITAAIASLLARGTAALDDPVAVVGY
jgi:glutathione synthase/RimK-type ligase-like ATP-grasp enzyme